MTTGSDIQADELLQALGQEIVKVYQVFDGSSRVITRYEAVANALNNQVCLRTDFSYTGANTQPTAMKEYLDVWSSSYDF